MINSDLGRFKSVIYIFFSGKISFRRGFKYLKGTCNILPLITLEGVSWSVPLTPSIMEQLVRLFSSATKLDI